MHFLFSWQNTYGYFNSIFSWQFLRISTYLRYPWCFCQDAHSYHDDQLPTRDVISSKLQLKASLITTIQCSVRRPTAVLLTSLQHKKHLDFKDSVNPNEKVISRSYLVLLCRRCSSGYCMSRFCEVASNAAHAISGGFEERWANSFSLSSNEIYAINRRPL